MTSVVSPEDTFGTMPFDHFLVEHWDGNSQIRQEEQEQGLLRTWINLGRSGRHVYYKRCVEVYDIPLPAYIPKDLSAFEKRTSVDPERWPSIWAIWIRTWYDDDTVSNSGSLKDSVTHVHDETYRRLWQCAFHPLEHNGEFDDDIVGPFVFDDNSSAYGVEARDADDEVEIMGEVPSFVSGALKRCPDAMEGCSESSGDYWLAKTDEELASSQALLVLVADREACEEGWVVMIALNHKRQLLRMRRRCKAYEVALNVTFCKDGGEPLNEGGEEIDVVDYQDASRSGNGWDDDLPL